MCKKSDWLVTRKVYRHYMHRKAALLLNRVVASTTRIFCLSVTHQSKLSRWKKKQTCLCTTISKRRKEVHALGGCINTRRRDQSWQSYIHRKKQQQLYQLLAKKKDDAEEDALRMLMGVECVARYSRHWEENRAKKKAEESDFFFFLWIPVFSSLPRGDRAAAHECTWNSFITVYTPRGVASSRFVIVTRSRLRRVYIHIAHGDSMKNRLLGHVFHVVLTLMGKFNYTQKKKS